MPPEICPNCGAGVPPNAKACPDCGSDEQTGWSEDAAAVKLGLPDESFDYQRFVREEFGGPQPSPPGAAWHWWAVVAAVFLILAGILMWR